MESRTEIGLCAGLLRDDAHGRPKHEGLAQQPAPEPGDRAGQPRKRGVYEPGDAGAEVCVQGVGVYGEKMRVCECVSVGVGMREASGRATASRRAAGKRE